MLPGHIAGIYTREQCHINLVRLARFANVRLVQATVTGLDPVEQVVTFSDGRPPIHYDVLSIDIGSTPNMTDVGQSDGTAMITPVKPIDGFSAAWARILSRVVSTSTPMSMVVVGGGAGGVELVLSMQARIHRERGGDDGLVTFSLVSHSPTILPNHNAHTQHVMTNILQRRGVQLLLGKTAMGVERGELLFKEGGSVVVNECVWCTPASAASWLRHTKISLDNDGFIAVGPTLQTLNFPNVFAAGDVAGMVQSPRPKAGVFAVRQGPPLANNLRALLSGEELVTYEPQTDFLGLITTGDPRCCVASRGDLGIEGDWIFPLKDWIDRKWMADYTTALPFMAPKETQPPIVAQVAGPTALALFQHKGMRCAGCGAKVCLGRKKIEISQTLCSGFFFPFSFHLFFLFFCLNASMSLCVCLSISSYFILFYLVTMVQYIYSSYIMDHTHAGDMQMCLSYVLHFVYHNFISFPLSACMYEKEAQNAFSFSLPFFSLLLTLFCCLNLQGRRYSAVQCDEADYILDCSSSRDTFGRG